MSSDPRHAPRAVWFALLGPPAAWFAALNAGYFMVTWACESAAGRVTLHATMAAMLALGVAAGVAGLVVWRREGRTWPGEAADPATRTRFLAVLGVFGAVVFSAAILWFWLAAVVLDPCDPGPRTPRSPLAAVEAVRSVSS